MPVIGRAIIGSSRMVTAAEPYDILINSYPGSIIKSSLDDPTDKITKDIEIFNELA